MLRRGRMVVIPVYSVFLLSSSGFEFVWKP